MPAPSKNSTREELIEIIRATPGHGRQYEIAKTLLDIKAAEENVALQEKIASQSKNLTKATWVLALATIVLALASIGLIIATVYKG
jgi:CHASE3 domain sensor protein